MTRCRTRSRGVATAVASTQARSAAQSGVLTTLAALSDALGAGIADLLDPERSMQVMPGGPLRTG